ncbi:MAG: DUF5916 domain-containing protein [Longimicrobiales bacterium]
MKQLTGAVFVGLALLATVSFQTVHAQESNGAAAAESGGGARSSSGLVIPRFDGAIEVDGVVDESAWSQIDPLPMTMYSPTFGGSLTERTEVRIAHDDQYLYVSGRLYESEPSQIRTNTFYRDQYSGDDLLAVVIDSYNDYETAVWFVTNPAGARQDRTVSNDAQFTGGMPMNADWNSHWDVATTQNEEGWFAEFRIPFSTLGFQAIDGEVTMGLIAYRFIGRKNERQLFPAIDPKWGGLGFAKPSQAERITMRGVRQSKPIYVTPYALGGVRQSPELRQLSGSPNSAWGTLNDPTTEAGLDLKYSPTSNLALDLTVNTDFAQVEADDQQINLTRFPLFFPEKRQFFQERSSTFDFNTGGFTNRLFHSRQIGLDGGEIVRIYGGARAVGRAGGTDFGFLNMQTAGQGVGSGENMGVLRVRQQVLNPYSSVGGMLTSRLGSLGRDNVAYGLDAVLRPVGDEYLTVRWAQTFDEATVEAGTLESGLILARWERVRDDGFSYSGEFGRVGSDYTPGLGFQLRKDFTSYGGSLQYKRFKDADSPLRSIALRMNTELFYRNEDGSAESRLLGPEYHIETKGGAQFTARLNYNFESVADSFFISNVGVAPGEYWFHEGEVNVMLPRSDMFRGEFGASVGRFYDGTRVGLSLGPAWNVSKFLELTGGYQVNRLNFADRGVGTTVHLARLKVQVALNTRFSLSSLAQYNSAADLTSFNVRFRYHFREGTDLWVVYNEGLNTERSNGLDPRLPLSAGRTAMLKYSHALIW